MLGQMTIYRDSKFQTQRIPGIKVSGTHSTNPSTSAVVPSAAANDQVANWHQVVTIQGRRPARA